MRDSWSILLQGDDFAWDEKSLAVYLKDVCIAEFKGELTEYIYVHKEIK